VLLATRRPVCNSLFPARFRKYVEQAIGDVGRRGGRGGLWSTDVDDGRRRRTYGRVDVWSGGRRELRASYRLLAVAVVFSPPLDRPMPNFYEEKGPPGPDLVVGGGGGARRPNLTLTIQVVGMLLPLVIVLHLTIAAPLLSAAVATMNSRAAIAQLRSTSSKSANLFEIARCMGWAKKEGASMLFLPECLGFVGDNAKHTLASADPPIDSLLRRDVPTNTSGVRKMMADVIDSCSREDNAHGLEKGADGSQQQADEPVESIIRELQFVASQAKLWISGGGVHTRAPSSTSSEKIRNTHVIIDSDGRIRAYYHKVHLFDVSIPGKVALRESNTTEPGEELVVVESPLGKLGLGICYDMRFPESKCPRLSVSLFVHCSNSSCAQSKPSVRRAREAGRRGPPGPERFHCPHGQGALARASEG